MEKLTDILNRTGKATVRELAAILKIDFRDALALLHDHEQEGRAVCVNGYWQLAEASNLPFTNCVTKPATSGTEVVPGKTDTPAEKATAPLPAATAPLKVIWSAPEETQEFPTLVWVRQRRRELRNEMRWLSQIENIARQIDRKKAAVAYFRERG